jgi:transmembrane sensor
MKNINEDIGLITRVLTGEATVEEEAYLLKWIEESKSNQQLFFEMKDIWEASQAINDVSIKSDESWERFRNQIEIIEEEKEAEKKSNKLMIFLKIAAIVIVTFGLSWLSFSLIMPKPSLTAKNEIITPEGSKTKIVLPDGTKVWLNSRSNLTYYANYNNKNRDVQLSGEAYFEVVKNPNKPFIVKTGKIDIKAYGTTFNVKSYSTDRFVETTLINGLVIIEQTLTKKTLAILKPHQKSIVLKDNLILKDNLTPQLKNILKLAKQDISKDTEFKIDVNSNSLLVQSNTIPETAWKDQKLYFTSETFDEIAIKLERWYGVEIHLQSDELKNERFTGKFTHNEPLVKVLEAIKITTPITYTIQLNEVYINLKSKPEKVNAIKYVMPMD